MVCYNDNSEEAGSHRRSSGHPKSGLACCPRRRPATEACDQNPTHCAQAASIILHTLYV